MVKNYKATSIRTFIGAKNYEESIRFYELLDFEKVVLSNNMIYFRVNESLGFYLQDAYVKDWVDNSMVFLEVENIMACWEDLKARKLAEQFDLVRLSEIKDLAWGSECFLHDPSGVLWHFGQFNK